jgi:3-oxoacyl-[acyl-carrier protein] reductase
MAGQVAIVTGGATGIGYATALQLARLGASVVIASRTESELSAAAAKIEVKSGSRCLPVVTNVKDEQAVAHLVQRTVDEFGQIDVLVNNAGGARLTPLENIPTKAWDVIFDLNVRSAYFSTREAGKHMIERKSGSIINISSGAGVHGVKGGAPYAAAKSALQMFTAVTAAEWGRFGIRCNAVAPGLIASPRSLAAWEAVKIDPEQQSASIPLRRVGTPDEVANMIVFLASRAGSYITGQTISVNGGPAMGGVSDG